MHVVEETRLQLTIVLVLVFVLALIGDHKPEQFAQLIIT